MFTDTIKYFFKTDRNTRASDWTDFVYLYNKYRKTFQMEQAAHAKIVTKRPCQDNNGIARSCMTFFDGNEGSQVVRCDCVHFDFSGCNQTQCQYNQAITNWIKAKKLRGLYKKQMLNFWAYKVQSRQSKVK